KMSYAIIRNANYKKDNLAGLYKHNERKNTNYSNKDINKNNSIKNYSIKQCNTTYSKALNQLIDENNLKCRITSYTNLVCEFIITSDKEFFETIGEEETKRYFQTAYNFVASYKNLGEQYILSAKIHLDESTPHLHLVFVPVIQTKDKNGNPIKRIACSEYWKGKDSYKKLQDNFYKYITKNGFDLERGKQREIEHLSTEKLKQVTNFDNIKYEMTQEEIKSIITQNKDLIIAQNKELVKYVNKLKLHLSKSYTAIKTMEKLQKENINLRYENQELKRENHNLKNYISKTFEVVKHLFNFSKDTFKRLVDNFVNQIEK
ncbi:MAG: plasmid recombination protein, partial [Clostridia bacterium]|nr:plasmid recombination protein [Clostridia bacterium]